MCFTDALSGPDTLKGQTNPEIAVRSLLVLLFWTLAAPALASDGVLEINQTCAAKTGCFPGDTAGLPVTIAASGSYRLTSDLLVPDENTHGIVVDASEVAIDLNRFSIIREACVGVTTDCTPQAGLGTGVVASSPERLGTTVRNGSVVGMGQFGLDLAAQAEISGLRVRWTANVAIAAGEGCVVTGSLVYQNGSDGINVSNGCLVQGNTAHSNGEDGIEVSAGSTVAGNSARSNSGAGIRLAAGSGYRGNTVSSNGGGTIVGGKDAGGNVCDGTLTCP